MTTPVRKCLLRTYWKRLQRLSNYDVNGNVNGNLNGNVNGKRNCEKQFPFPLTFPLKYYSAMQTLTRFLSFSANGWTRAPFES